MIQVFRFLRFVFGKPPGIFISRLLLKVLPETYKLHLYEDFFTRARYSFMGAILKPAADREYYVLKDDERERFNREKFGGGSRQGMA